MVHIWSPKIASTLASFKTKTTLSPCVTCPQDDPGNQLLVELTLSFLHIPLPSEKVALLAAVFGTDLYSSVSRLLGTTEWIQGDGSPRFARKVRFFHHANDRRRTLKIGIYSHQKQEEKGVLIGHLTIPMVRMLSESGGEVERSYLLENSSNAAIRKLLKAAASVVKVHSRVSDPALDATTDVVAGDSEEGSFCSPSSSTARSDSTPSALRSSGGVTASLSLFPPRQPRGPTWPLALCVLSPHPYVFSLRRGLASLADEGQSPEEQV